MPAIDVLLLKFCVKDKFFDKKNKIYSTKSPIRIILIADNLGVSFGLFYE